MGGSMSLQVVDDAYYLHMSVYKVLKSFCISILEILKRLTQYDNSSTNHSHSPVDTLLIGSGSYSSDSIFAIKASCMGAINSSYSIGVITCFLTGASVNDTVWLAAQWSHVHQLFSGQASSLRNRSEWSVLSISLTRRLYHVNNVPLTLDLFCTNVRRCTPWRFRRSWHIALLKSKR